MRAQRRAEEQYWAWASAQPPPAQPPPPGERPAPPADQITPAQQAAGGDARSRAEAALREAARQDAIWNRRTEHEQRVREREQGTPSRQELEKRLDRLAAKLNARPSRPTLSGAAALWFLACLATFAFLSAVSDIGDQEALVVYPVAYGTWAIVFLTQYLLRRLRWSWHERRRPVWNRKLEELRLVHGCGKQSCVQCYKWIPTALARLSGTTV